MLGRIDVKKEYSVKEQFKRELCDKLSPDLIMKVNEDFEFLDANAGKFTYQAQTTLTSPFRASLQFDIPIKIKMKKESFTLLKLKYYGK